MSSSTEDGDLRTRQRRAPDVSLDEVGPLERFRRNPAGWGVALGAGMALVSLWLVWIELSPSVGASERFRLIESFTGQSLFFATILAALAGLGAATSTSGWRIFFAVAALLLGALLTAASAWALFDPSGFTRHVADASAYSTMTASTGVADASDALSRAFASGLVTASAGVGTIVGLVGGGLTVLGALLSFSPPGWRGA